MYFVVFLPVLKRNVILPPAWIEKIDDHLEKFMNYSVNSSQLFLCYYTTNELVFDSEGRPKGDISPDFSLDLITEVGLNGDFDGCFLGKIKKFKWNYEDAANFMKRQRDIEPPIYNEKRLTEQPIPLINQNESTMASEMLNNLGDSLASNVTETDESGVENSNDCNENGLDAINTTFEDENHVEQSSSASDANTNIANILFADGNNGLVDPFISDSTRITVPVLSNSANTQSVLGSRESIELFGLGNDENLIPVPEQNNSDDISRDPLLIDEIKTEFINPCEMFIVDAARIQDLLADDLDTDVMEGNNSVLDTSLKEDIYDEDTTIYVGKSGIPKPKVLKYQLVKQEKDAITGDIPFKQTETGRVYEIGGKLFEIPKKVVEKIIAWNSKPYRTLTNCDMKIFQLLFWCLIDEEDHKVGNVAGEVMQFIKCCFVVRCDGNKNRIAAIEQYKDKLRADHAAHAD